MSDKRLTDSELEAFETFATPMMSTALVRLVAEIREHRTRTAPAGLTQEEREALEHAYMCVMQRADRPLTATARAKYERTIAAFQRLLAGTAPAPAPAVIALVQRLVAIAPPCLYTDSARRWLRDNGAGDPYLDDGKLMEEMVTPTPASGPRKHPMAPDICPDCEWCNTGLDNYGTPGHSIWLCHGCAGRRIRGESPIATPATAEREG